MLRTRLMSQLSARLAALVKSLNLPEGVSLSIDVDPVSLL